MRWLKIDPRAAWPYGLGGVVTGFVATLLLAGGPAPRQFMADAMHFGAPPAVRAQPAPASPAVPSDVAAATGSLSGESGAAAPLKPPPPEAAVENSVFAGPTGAEKPPYPSPLMPCRRLANSYHQSMSGPDGPPGFRCRQLRAGN